MPYGRGGAGNIEIQQRQREQAAGDVEAQQRQVHLTGSDSTSGDNTDLAQYAYTGRGGIGNIYSPKDLAATGSFARTEILNTDQSDFLTQPQTTKSTEDRHSRVVLVQQSGAPTIQKVGRGGAGNYEFTSSQSQEAKALDQDKEKQREIASSVAQDVEEQLAVPPKARILTAGVYRG